MKLKNHKCSITNARDTMDSDHNMGNNKENCDEANHARTMDTYRHLLPLSG